jgi:hypothetical protein
LFGHDPGVADHLAPPPPPPQPRGLVDVVGVGQTETVNGVALTLSGGTVSRGPPSLLAGQRTRDRHRRADISWKRHRGSGMYKVVAVDMGLAIDLIRNQVYREDQRTLAEVRNPSAASRVRLRRIRA